jgi:hypothetical protein
MIMRMALAATVSVFLLTPVAAKDAPPMEGRPLDGPMTPDIPAQFKAIMPAADYDRREVMIPMRDGVKLFTVIIVPKGVTHGPILLTRTPYNAGKTTSRHPSQKVTEILPIMDAEFVRDGYIRVYQDVRGRNKSEGDYVMTRPLRGPLNESAVDHATDAYDTIDWLVKNVPETNGKVGVIGSSYPGFTTLMATVDPHPALKAVVPQSPMVDGWIGDDWFHNGAFRQTNFDYIAAQTGAKTDGDKVAMGTGVDDYAAFLAAGSAGDYARKYGLEQLPFTRKLMDHPSYDGYWQNQAVDKLLAKRPVNVPMMLVVGQWDQEDSYGAPAVYRALEPKDTGNDKVFFVVGPWRHSGVNADGSSLGPLKLPGDTALAFRRDVMKPFLDTYLKDGAPKAATPPVLTFETGVGRWQEAKQWPMGAPQALYLQAGFGLGFEKPAKADHDDYVSDPAKPVPFVPRPVHWEQGDVWRPWLTHDQRFVDGRPDVITYVTPPLTKAVHIAGAPQVDLVAATSGTDSDWVVKLIDVYPEEMSDHPELAGYELGIGMDIFRGRYVHGLDKPQALTPGKPEHVKFALPNVNHAFLPGHRIMVQIQSTWFPLYDRNPQTFVDNIFNARAEDYRRATQSVYRGGDRASAIVLPVVAD